MSVTSNFITIAQCFLFTHNNRSVSKLLPVRLAREQLIFHLGQTQQFYFNINLLKLLNFLIKLALLGNLILLISSSNPISKLT